MKATVKKLEKEIHSILLEKDKRLKSLRIDMESQIDDQKRKLADLKKELKEEVGTQDLLNRLHMKQISELKEEEQQVVTELTE